MSDEKPARSMSIVSPMGLASAAASVALLYAIAHALGLRAYTSILSGTAPPGADGTSAIALGLAYTALYFAAAIGAPILAIAAAIMAGIMRRRR